MQRKPSPEYWRTMNKGWASPGFEDKSLGVTP